MRYALCAAAILLLATLGVGTDAQAQIGYAGEGGCNKGMFWPFVRSPGDCLTDAERGSGMSGTYRESEVQSSDTGAAAPAVSESQTSVPTAAQPQPSTSPPIAASPAPQSATPGAAAIQPAAARAEQTANPSAQQDPNADGRATYTGEGGCTKGVFWPFVRRAGDCLTDAESRSGQSGTYQ